MVQVVFNNHRLVEYFPFSDERIHDWRKKLLVLVENKTIVEHVGKMVSDDGKRGCGVLCCGGQIGRNYAACTVYRDYWERKGIHSLAG